jgi:hypothetical protein
MNINITLPRIDITPSVFTRLFTRKPYDPGKYPIAAGKLGTEFRGIDLACGAAAYKDRIRGTMRSYLRVDHMLAPRGTLTVL